MHHFIEESERLAVLADSVPRVPSRPDPSKRGPAAVDVVYESAHAVPADA